MDTLEKLIKAKAGLKGSITRIETFIDKVSTDTNKTELEVKLKKLDLLQQRVDELRQYSFCIEKVTSEELSEFQNEIDQCEERLEELEVRIKLFLNSNKKNTSVTDFDEKQNENLLFKTKIPPIVLPTFSGSYENFSSFKNQFDDLITSNDTLSQSQKLHYLNSCLIDKVKEFSTSFDTFDSLYEALKTRYENKRLTVDIHVQSILNFKKIERENAQELRAMIDCITKNLRALKSLNYEQNDLFDIFLLNIMLKKLDKETRKNFELLQKTKDVPTLENFLMYLENRENVLLAINRNEVIPFKNSPCTSKSKVFLTANNEKQNKFCVICKNISHPLFKCDKFLKLTVDERFKLVRFHKLCEICFNKNHIKSFCRYRSSKFANCTCGKIHSKLMCYKINNSFPPPHQELNEVVNSNEKEISQEINKDSISQSVSVLSNLKCSKEKRKNILLSTANVYLLSANNERIKIRAILDSASNISVLSKKITEYLGIPKKSTSIPVTTLNGFSQNIKFKLNTHISNENCSFNEPVEFLIVDKITEFTPSTNLDISNLQIPSFLNLADDSFYEANEVQALISADIFFKVLKYNTYKVSDDLFFKESEFGWLACGKLEEKQFSKKGHCFLVKEESLQSTLKSFFDLESIGISDDPALHEQDKALEIFNDTVKFNNGRYIVQLPFKKSYKELADNYSLAKQRFQNLWRRLSHDSELHKNYREIIKDYLEQGIIERVSFKIPETDVDTPLYYLPHQAIRKESSLTSKTRIVFDAGSHENNELSLNCCLWPGINLNPNLLDLLINFRLNKIAFCSDIKQAFLQICLADEHKDAVRFLWSEEDPSIYRKPTTQAYRFNRVNFGVCSSPFLLAATIRHHIEKYKNEFPDTVQILDKCFYVDDLISGKNSYDEALEVSKSAKKIMNDAGMELRKWISNDATLMKQWEKDGFDTYPIDANVNLGASQTKILGLSWNTKEDYLCVNIGNLLEFISINKNTKRFILQTVGKLFDPLGLISPFIIRVKCLIQDLWSEKIPWDDPLPPGIEKEFKKWCTELPFLENLKIPRFILDSISQEDTVEIHSFSDASKKCYGAAVYLKLKNSKGISVNLITSKTRVAPLSGVTLPRLELLGALVAARLTAKVKNIVNQKKPSVQYHWTDSKIVLFWIKGSKVRWKQFVSNRVTEITSLTDPNSWYHCAGKDNPADLLSRGMSAESLLTNSRWWTGPEFLQNSGVPIEELPIVPEFESLSESEREILFREKKKDSETVNSEKTVLFTEDSNNFIDKVLKYSNNYFKITNILSYVFRFIFNCRNKERRVGFLTPEEIKDAEVFLIKHEQKSFFVKKQLPSNIANLYPFVDNNGIVRVGGRLKNASVPYNQKYPPILPKCSKLSRIYFDSMHRRLFHVGPLGLLNAVRLKFWPLNGRSLAREIVHKCVQCFKCKPTLSSQLMGNLPRERVNVAPTFSITGIDLCGPYLVKFKNQRKVNLNKVYICICICFVTKAIHLELLSDLTSDALIATLKRFTSRRGKCSKIYTDNATNFVGSNSKLKKFYKLINFPDKDLTNYFNSENMNWNFIPPKSPHFGGLWEAGVKSVKHHLKRTIGDYHFTYEEFETVMIQVEGILNSRPLTPLSNDSDNYEVLTPGHFLIGRPITALPEPPLIDIRENRLSRWQKTTKVVQLIWEKWKSDYLNTLQARSKWMVDKNDIKNGQMVVVKEDHLPVNTWLLGRITAVYHGSDGKVRVVKVRTKSGEFKRAIAKIAILPIESNN